MLYKITADMVVAIHMAWILFLIFGALAGRYARWIKWTHIGGLIFSLALLIFSWICPLTHLEVWLRNRYDPSLTYTGSFIAQYLERLVYLEIPRVALLIGTLGVVVFSVWVYTRPYDNSLRQS